MNVPLFSWFIWKSIQKINCNDEVSMSVSAILNIHKNEKIFRGNLHAGENPFSANWQSDTLIYSCFRKYVEINVERVSLT